MGRTLRRDLPARFAASSRGVAAIEFAIMAPVLVMLMLSGLQLVLYINAARKVELVATSISEMISQAAPPSASSTVATVNATDLHFSFDAAMVLFPYILTDGRRNGLQWWQDIYIDYASIQFTQTASNCTDPTDLSKCYSAAVVWTSSGTTGSNYRPCGIAQTAANNSASPTTTTLPRSVFGPGSLIVIDVVFNFTPTFGNAIIPSIRIARSVYVQPRYASLIKLDPLNTDVIASTCPGF